MKPEVPRGAILVVDDDESIRHALVERIRHWGHLTREAHDGEEALETAAREEFDLVFLDLSMPGRGGMEVLKTWAEAGYGADVIVLTAHGSVDAAVEAIRLGAADFLQKPADFGLVEAAVNRLLSKRSLARVNRALREQIGDEALPFVAADPAMTELLETARRSARGNSTILLTGESGSGKQVVAEFIHRQSPRSQGPFVYVNCVAISDELIESTLFGHERGAFTTAVARKEGRLEAAAGGTAFLDEVGDITPRLQSKLLHFLESGEFERVGSTRTIRVDCRVIAATNRDLESAVREGSFREDLYFRLNVIRLPVPPLRKRPADILPLAEAFLRRYGAGLGRGKLRLSDRTSEILRRYPWPGNVRQLRNALERMVVLAPGDVLTPDLLPPEVLGMNSGGTDEDLDDLPFHQAVESFKKRYLAHALARTGGNQSLAAEQIGLQRTHLNRMLKELGLRGPAE